jgi:D-alanine--poly(phosphoribitol) ligase subunit 2
MCARCDVKEYAPGLAAGHAAPPGGRISMDTEEIKKVLRDHIVQHYAVPVGDPDFNDDVHLFDYGYVDSFGAVSLVAFVQEAFGVQVSQSDMVAYPLNTINEIATFTSLRKSGEL